MGLFWERKLEPWGVRVLGGNDSPELPREASARHSLIHSFFILSLLPSLIGSSNSHREFTYLSDTKLQILGAVIPPKPPLDVSL